MRRFAFFVLMTACSMPAGLDTQRNNPIDPQADPAQQRCGNSIINSGEECDDGNTVVTDSCTDTCKLARCGDGHIRTDLGADEVGFEACDNGEANSDTGACLDNCTVAQCGDGFVRSDLVEGEEGFENCEDGNPVDTDDCTNGCLLARCGDGIVRTTGGNPSSFAPCANGDGCSEGEVCTNDRCVNPNHEVCDDGNSVNDDGCSNTCQVGRCGDGVIQPGEECDAGETASDYCIECTLKRCDSGCFDALDPESTDHCVRVPVPGGLFVNACLPAQGAPTALPAPLGVCRSGEGDLDPSKPCARDDDCDDDSYTCDIRPAWHRCVTSEPNRLHGFLQSCVPDEGDCSDGLLCSLMVAKRWHGFCDAGESPEGWYLTGYQTQIPGRDEVVCYPSACEGVGVEDSADQPIIAPANACPHLNGFGGQSTQNTYCAAGSDFTQAQLTACLWEECKANADDQEDAEEVCDHHQDSGAEPARCTDAEVCGYATDIENAPAHLYPLDLTHPFNLSSFADRCASACMFRGATCTAVHDGLSPVAQAQCMVCDSDDCCPDGTFRATGTDDHFFELAGLCLSECLRDAECDQEFRCDIEEGRRGFCVPKEPERETVHDDRTALVPCESHTDCADSLCLPMVTWRPDSPKVCQLKPCRHEWDCPITQNCGGGRCRQDILCGWGDLSCGSGAMCTQTQVDFGLYGPSCENDSTCQEADHGDAAEACQWGACSVACEANEDCGEHHDCVYGFCVFNQDFGTCRLPGLVTTGDAEEPVRVTPVDMETFSEGFMLEGDFYREFEITLPNRGLLWLHGYARSDLRCQLMGGEDRLVPVDIAYRLNIDPNQCSGWFEVSPNQTYTFRVRLAEASNRMWRRPTQVLIEGQFVQEATVTASCQDGQLNAWEGCIDPDPNESNDGCVNCRCIEPLLQRTQGRSLASNWHVQDTSFLGCHHGHTEPILYGSDYPFAADEESMVFVADSVDFEAEDTWIDCMIIRRWMEDGEDREEHLGKDDELSSNNACVVVLEPQRGDRVDFYARWDGEPPLGPIPVRYITGIRCAPENGGAPCSDHCATYGEISVCEEFTPAP